MPSPAASTYCVSPNRSSFGSVDVPKLVNDAYIDWLILIMTALLLVQSKQAAFAHHITSINHQYAFPRFHISHSLTRSLSHCRYRSISPFFSHRLTCNLKCNMNITLWFALTTRNCHGTSYIVEMKHVRVEDSGKRRLPQVGFLEITNTDTQNHNSEHMECMDRTNIAQNIMKNLCSSFYVHSYFMLYSVRFLCSGLLPPPIYHSLSFTPSYSLHFYTNTCWAQIDRMATQFVQWNRTLVFARKMWNDLLILWNVR